MFAIVAACDRLEFQIHVSHDPGTRKAHQDRDSGRIARKRLNYRFTNHPATLFAFEFQTGETVVIRRSYRFMENQ